MTRPSESLSMRIYLQVITYYDYLIPRRRLILIITAILSLSNSVCRLGDVYNI